MFAACFGEIRVGAGDAMEEQGKKRGFFYN